MSTGDNMRLRGYKLHLTILAAAAILAVAIHAASASHLSTNERGFRVTWASLEFNSGIGIVLRCPLTLEGEFSSATINKTPSAVVGNITSANVANASCTNGHATALTERLPWKITYEAFTGTLPNITGLKFLLLRPAYKIEAVGITCLAEPARILSIVTGRIEAGGAFKPESITPESEGLSCGSFSGTRYAGTGNTTKRGSTERILVTLI